MLQNIRWLAGANVAVKPIWFLFLLFSARLLGPGEFGKYMFAIAYVSVIAVFLEGGVDILTVRQLASEPDSFTRVFSHTSILKLLSAVGTGMIAFVSTFVVDISSTTRTLIVGAIVYSTFNTLMLHFRSIFRAFEVMKYEAQSIFVEKLSVVVICAAALSINRGAELFTASYAIAYLIASGVTLVLVARHIGWPDWRIDARYLWLKIVKPALPYALMGFFMIVYFRSGTIMLKMLTGREELVGYYNAGYRLVESFILFPAVITSPMYPTFTRSGSDRVLIGRLLYQATRTISVISLTVSVPLFLFRHEFTLMLFGDAYADAAPAVGIIGLAMIPVGLTWVFGSLVAAIGRQPKANVLIFLITVMNVVLHAVAIPRIGLLGASLVTLLTEIAMALACLWIVRDYVPRIEFSPFLWRASVPPLLACMLKATGVFGGSFVFQLGLILATMLSAFSFLGIISLSDLKKLGRHVDA